VNFHSKSPENQPRKAGTSAAIQFAGPEGCAGDCATCRLLCEKEVAPILRVSVSWLQKARVRGTGPSFVKIGRKVFYRLCTIQAYQVANVHMSTSTYKPDGGANVA